MLLLATSSVCFVVTTRKFRNEMRSLL